MSTEKQGTRPQPIPEATQAGLLHHVSNLADCMQLGISPPSPRVSPHPDNSPSSLAEIIGSHHSTRHPMTNATPTSKRFGKCRRDTPSAAHGSIHRRAEKHVQRLFSSPGPLDGWSLRKREWRLERRMFPGPFAFLRVLCLSRVGYHIISLGEGNFFFSVCSVKGTVRANVKSIWGGSILSLLVCYRYLVLKKIYRAMFLHSTSFWCTTSHIQSRARARTGCVLTLGRPLKACLGGKYLLAVHARSLNSTFPLSPNCAHQCASTLDHQSLHRCISSLSCICLKTPFGITGSPLAMSSRSITFHLPTSISLSTSDTLRGRIITFGPRGWNLFCCFFFRALSVSSSVARFALSTEICCCSGCSSCALASNRDWFAKSSAFRCLATNISASFLGFGFAD